MKYGSVLQMSHCHPQTTHGTPTHSWLCHLPCPWDGHIPTLFLSVIEPCKHVPTSKMVPQNNFFGFFMIYNYGTPGRSSIHRYYRFVVRAGQYIYVKCMWWQDGTQGRAWIFSFLARSAWWRYKHYAAHVGQGCSLEWGSGDMDETKEIQASLFVTIFLSFMQIQSALWETYHRTTQTPKQKYQWFVSVHTMMDLSCSHLIHVTKSPWLSGLRLVLYSESWDWGNSFPLSKSSSQSLIHWYSVTWQVFGNMLGTLLPMLCTATLGPWDS